MLKEGFLEKIRLLELIGSGIKDKNALAFELDTSDISLFIADLANDKMIDGVDNLHLTLKGLLFISSLNSESEEEMRVENEENEPYFEYNNELGKDVLFSPYLHFDERENYFEEESVKLYHTKIIFNQDIQVLQAIEDQIATIGYGTHAFWTIQSQRKLTGYRICNAFEAIKKYTFHDYNLKFVLSEAAYIIVGEVISENNETEIKLDFYLSNCGEWPYVDVLQYLEGKLKFFLNYIKLDRIPRGKEIVIKSRRDLLSTDDEERLTFVPVLKGKLYFGADISEKIKELPLIVPLDPKNIDGKIKLTKVSPWFVCLPGGFGDDDFDGKRKLHPHWFESYEFDNSIVIQFMVNIYDEEEEELWNNLTAMNEIEVEDIDEKA